ncbi:hypothetical protein K503DRAFT_87007 [Rhizopogon vinicolor AM-OR11-026]|uniref:Uncharacterized protein n=1 Tax=Rhizopogon vinicolor AM-OR11-026 TaxID=1314800 RepID=A0A1B7MFM9_9AGAM|nr:hypothetical protein K503DRAFT_87007 [Rhizopogon vinicolor AM-OR11-026]
MMLSTFSLSAQTIERVLMIHGRRISMRWGRRRRLSSRSSQRSSLSDAPEVEGSSSLKLLPSVDVDAERAGEQGSSLNMSKASLMENEKAESATRGEGHGDSCDLEMESLVDDGGSESNSKSFSDSPGMMWNGRGLPLVQVAVEDELDGVQPGSEDIEMEGFRVQVRGLASGRARFLEICCLDSTCLVLIPYR